MIPPKAGGGGVGSGASRMRGRSSTGSASSSSGSGTAAERGNSMIFAVVSAAGSKGTGLGAGVVGTS